MNALAYNDSAGLLRSLGSGPLYRRVLIVCERCHKRRVPVVPADPPPTIERPVKCLCCGHTQPQEAADG